MTGSLEIDIGPMYTDDSPSSRIFILGVLYNCSKVSMLFGLLEIVKKAIKLEA